MSGICLVLGGNGFLGHYVTQELIRNHKNVRCIVRRNPRDEDIIQGVDYIVGDAFDSDFLGENLKDVELIYDFISTSLPNSGEKSLEKEINITLRTLDDLLSLMVHSGVRNIVYPSSGGAIYGDQSGRTVSEETLLRPTTPYGIGKQLSEDVLKYYSRKHQLNAIVFRIGNVYGSRQLRDKLQGVVDVFIQSALNNEPIKIWGDASKSIRDYVYLEDAASAIVQTTELGLMGYHVFNVGTGRGTSVQQLIRIIEEKLHRKLEIEYIPQKTSGVNGIVLDCGKIKKITGWEYKVAIDIGIDLTIQTKKKILGIQ